jgi:microcompartment protein CcmL/EutN
MNAIKSIGLIETLGMIGAVEAADAALKAANVTLLGYEFNGAGYVVIKLTGDVAAVKAAISSGGATARRLGNLVATHVIPRPDGQVIDTEICTPQNVPPFPGPDDKSSGGKADATVSSSTESKVIKPAAAKPAETGATAKKAAPAVKPASGTTGKKPAPAAKPSGPSTSSGKPAPSGKGGLR